MTLAVAIAIATSLALTPLARRLAWRFNAVSHPDGRRRLHSQPIPLWGGGSVYLALLLSITIAHLLTEGSGTGPSLPAALALSAGILGVLGCYDDLFDMNARWKLFWQIGATLPIVLFGGCVERVAVFGHPLELGLWGAAFTIGWLVLGINAMNLLDGTDGLASVVGIAISIVIATLAWYQGDPAVMRLALVLAGALTGFLVYNLPPARIYLGDCGSMIIGLTLALLVLRVSIDGALGAVRLTMAAALLFVPFLDTALAIVRRTLNGSGFMAADRGHIHHRLQDRGLNNWKILGFLGGLCLATGAVAWVVAFSRHDLWAWALLATLLAALVNRRLVGHTEWGLARQVAARFVWRSSPKETPFQLRAVVPPDLPNRPTAQGDPSAKPPPGEAGGPADDSKAAA